MLCPKPGCAISVGLEQQEELVAVGMAVGFGSEGRSRDDRKGPLTARGSPVVASRP